MPETLHSSQGLTIVRNKRNHFIVCTLHYTADPAKRSESWKNEARAGMRPANWEKEYEISYCALFGERVFPQFSEFKNKIVISPEAIDIPRSVSCWGGFDYGPRNPSSFHVYTCLNDVIYSIWELFEPCTNLPAFAARMQECPYWNQIRYIAADPAIWSLTQVKDNAMVSIADLFWQNGVTKLLKGNRDEQTFIAVLNGHWKDLIDCDPGLRIFSCCSNQIRELETAVYADQSAKVQQYKNLKEQISDFNNHSIDDLKYFLLSRPNFAATRSITIPNMAKWWRT